MMMNAEEANRVHGAVVKEIAKRTGISALKSLTIGHESLEKAQDWIADQYELSSAERKRLHPAKGTNTADEAAGWANKLRAGLGGSFAITEYTKLYEVFKAAQKSSTVFKTLGTLTTHGLTGAKAVAEGGKVVGKGNPLIFSAQAAYTVGFAGWFAVGAWRYNDACRRLVLEREGISNA